MSAAPPLPVERPAPVDTDPGPPAISVSGVSKQYRIGGREEAYRTFREALGDLVSAPLKRLRNGKQEAPTFLALKDVSFEVPAGQKVGIIGRNGAGKSTLLKVLTRITEPTTGKIQIRGRVASLLEVGTGFHPELTGRENIFLNGAVLGMTQAEIRSRFDEIVAFAEVERFIDTPVKRYSSGMYLRLAFAVAAHLEPEILIIDEVLAVGDMQFQKKCLGKMQSLGQTGRTILFVSHNMSAVTSLCDRAILLDQGRIVADGRPEAVVGQYLSSSLGSAATASWDDSEDAPGVNGFKLLSVSVRTRGGEPTAVFSVEDELKVEIVYRTTLPEIRFRVNALLSTQGTCAFVCVEPTEMVRGEPGVYASTVTIPGNLLAEGEYILGLSVFASRGKKDHLCRVEEVLSFQTYDPVTGSSARGDYTEGMLGVVRPKCEWRLERRQ